MEARTVSEFIEALSDKRASGSIFRGQCDASWRLTPGIYRQDIPNLPNGNYRAIEDTLLARFFQLAEAHLSKSERRNPLRDRIIAQHYGLRTSLLDWTKNPFVALYFACDNYDLSGKVFAGQTSTTVHNDTAQIPDSYLERAELVQIVPPSLDVRVVAQSSRFTLQPFPRDGELFVPLDERFPNDGGSKQRAWFSSIVIPKDAKPSLKRELNDYGVNELTVFPELQSVGRFLSQHLTGAYESWTDT